MQLLFYYIVEMLFDILLRCLCILLTSLYFFAYSSICCIFFKSCIIVLYTLYPASTPDIAVPKGTRPDTAIVNDTVFLSLRKRQKADISFSACGKKKTQQPATQWMQITTSRIIHFLKMTPLSRNISVRSSQAAAVNQLNVPTRRQT